MVQNRANDLKRLKKFTKMPYKRDSFPHFHAFHAFHEACKLTELALPPASDDILGNATQQSYHVRMWFEPLQQIQFRH